LIVKIGIINLLFTETLNCLLCQDMEGDHRLS
jgi:hypothetical protein